MKTDQKTETKRRRGHQPGSPLIHRDSIQKKSIIFAFHKEFNGSCNGKQTIQKAYERGFSLDYKTMKKYISEIKRDGYVPIEDHYDLLSENERRLVAYYRLLSEETQSLIQKSIDEVSQDELQKAIRQVLE